MPTLPEQDACAYAATSFFTFFCRQCASLRGYSLTTNLWETRYVFTLFANFICY